MDDVVPGEAATGPPIAIAARELGRPVAVAAWRIGWPVAVAAWKLAGRGDRPTQAEMVAAEAARVVADPHQRGEIVARRRWLRQRDFAAALDHLKVEVPEIAIRKRQVAFRPVVAGLLAGEPAD